MFLGSGHRVTNLFRKRSQGHGRISAVTNCDPGRGRMHCAYGSDHPLTREPPQQQTSRLDREVRCFRCRKKGHLYLAHQRAPVLQPCIVKQPPLRRHPARTLCFAATLSRSDPYKTSCSLDTGASSHRFHHIVCASRIGKREHVEPSASSPSVLRIHRKETSTRGR